MQSESASKYIIQSCDHNNATFSHDVYFLNTKIKYNCLNTGLRSKQKFSMREAVTCTKIIQVIARDIVVIS